MNEYFDMLQVLQFVCSCGCNGTIIPAIGCRGGVAKCVRRAGVFSAIAHKIEHVVQRVGIHHAINLTIEQDAQMQNAVAIIHDEPSVVHPTKCWLGQSS